ncbi:cell wall-binding repeat-containing protein [Bacillus safensis]|uniref:cell wall-binding repeat-containing protein n=1 Tax=Bacillus safensis TaxID=561879 RepID=UPI0022384749|nr:cell wall-binding repeat-containing protein [Bacillus safensis]MCW4645116.1 N-acetylmuramoyl-L-alanine amidase [Bacillus safensis]MCY7566362.1 N-acetylmuramoyl-L-alanine amidase [Bacillus safensis]MCY7624226.1 N-acetylmuramoyl-L-alanine amidase [Bacillus safensis]MCY7634007.1 N-acetylmuramoyl-L-alanine amidase [Bacillus safensis]MCY7648423.1 N-acetylmuramoyl-L-alanine amidase [Bacillus safensis]
MRFDIKCMLLIAISLCLYTPSVFAQHTVSRIEGSNRYEVAVNAAKRGWQEAPAVVLVGGDAYADALSAVPYAYHQGDPVLLTNAGSLSGAVKTGLQQLKTKRVTILGGTASISENVVKQLKAMNLSVSRIQGKNRYELAANVAKHMKSASAAVVVNGSAYADAVAIAPYAAKQGYPILLTDAKGLREETANLLKNKAVKRTIVIGGEASVNKTVFQKLPSPVRISGANRYEVAAQIAKTYPMKTSQTFMSHGYAYADAASAASIAAKQGQTHLLTDAQTVPDAIRKVIGAKQMSAFSVVGGTSTVQTNVITQLKNAVLGETIFIDPGHGAQDAGAIGNGLLEKNINLEVALKLRSRLHQAGALTVMSRTSDTFDSLQTRVSKGAQASADIFISIHANANDNSGANGTETYYDTTYAAAHSVKLAQQVQPRMVSALGTRDRGVKTAGFYVIKYSRMPSILLETGFVTSPIDASILKSTAAKDRLASGIATGVSNYFDVK